MHIHMMHMWTPCCCAQSQCSADYILALCEVGVIPVWLGAKTQPFFTLGEGMSFNSSLSSSIATWSLSVSPRLMTQATQLLRRFCCISVLSSEKSFFSETANRGSRKGDDCGSGHVPEATYNRSRDHSKHRQHRVHTRNTENTPKHTLKHVTIAKHGCTVYCN